jgi:ATP-dependent Clp protease ATP-binding subunit ClpX
LFIAGGAFDGIRKIFQRNAEPSGCRLFNFKNVDNDKDNLLQYIIPKDIKFRIDSEIIGRLPVLTHMDPLDRETLRAILTQPKNALIKQYTKLFLMDDVEFTINDEALDFIVDKRFRIQIRGSWIAFFMRGSLD